MEISLLDLKYAYLASWIEADGSIILKAHRDTRKRKIVSFGMYIKVSNTDKRIIDFLAENYGGNASKGYVPKGRKSAIYEWTVHGTNAQRILKGVYPYFVIKKEQAKLAFAFQEMLTSSSGRSYTESEYQERVRAVNKMHELNAKEKDKTWLKL